VLCVTAKGKPIKAKTLGQQNYVKAIQKNLVTLGIGPAGTGKTYLAVAAAVAAFRDKQVNRIILTRPAVEAGERLGFLPGDLQSKVDPYLRPLYDALFDMLGAETYNKYLERGNIEVAPLAYMRGRTLDDSFIILDEAQNTSREQMKMFLTRMGFNSKVVITGDITQIDLPADKISGLREAMRVLDGVEDIAICRLGQSDVVRHVMVQRIIKAYEEDEKRHRTGKGKN
jgi:phosphate starvation-inducible PhoH-like protein